jgi:hypothetical protein
MSLPMKSANWRQAPTGPQVQNGPQMTGSQQAERDAQEREVRQGALWKRVESNLKRMRFDRSPFVPSTFEEYKAHFQGLQTERVLKEMYHPEREKLQPVVLDMDLVRHCGLEQHIDPEQVALRRKNLCDLTVFAKDWKPTVDHPQAPWPCAQEFKEEGDERHTSGFGRYLPVPRAPVYGRINWKQNEYLEPYEMDKIHAVSKKFYDYLFPGDHEEHEPQVDENGVYIDDPMESGRVAYAGELPPAEAAAAARDPAWESQYFGECSAGV